jgi:hypothetical protein
VVTISVGFACSSPTQEPSAESLIKVADAALLTAKSNGRNRIEGEAPATPSRPRLSSQPWRRFPVVVLDPWFADRIPAFLSSIHVEIAGLREANDARNFERVRALTRRLRQTASEHNIATIVELGNLLERAARGEQPETIQRLSDDLEQYVEHVQVTYRRPLERKLGQAG